MIYLLLSVVCSVGIFLSFKIGRRYNISTLALITINYYVAVSFGICQILSRPNIMQLSSISAVAILLTILIGVLFVIMFYIASRSVQQAGMTISSAASKLSVVFPFFFSLLIDPADKITFFKLLAIIIILISIVLLSYRKNESQENFSGSLFPVLLFIGMGLVDSLVKFAQQVFIFSSLEAYFSTAVFFCSALAATSWYFARGNSLKQINSKAFFLGVGLGVSNFGSLFFFMKALNSNDLSGWFGSSSIFALNNISIIILASALGLFFFGEKLAPINIGGLLLSIIGIVILLYK